MKKHIIALILTAGFLFMIPLFTVKNISCDNIVSSFNSDKENNSGYLANLLAYEFREDYNEECLKAVAIILNSNYKAGVKCKSLSKMDFIKKYKGGESYYSIIEKTVKETENICIKYKGKPAAVPYAYITSGNCESEQPYLRDTQSPWDLINNSYTFDAPEGVSLNGINELCRNGLSCDEALYHYLKNIEIAAA